MRAWRGKLGISQEELAGRAGLHRTYVSDVERGARNVSLESIEKLANALEVSISALFAGGKNPVQGSGAPAFSHEELVNILFVEDNPDDVRLTLQAFEEANIKNRIHVVQDGAAALDFLYRRGDYANRRAADWPQIILLDLGLPKIGGLEVLRQIRADPRTRSIPVIVLTASKHDRDIIASRRLGADSYLVKPVDLQNLSEVTPQLSLQWALLKPINARGT